MNVVINWTNSIFDKGNLKIYKNEWIFLQKIALSSVNLKTSTMRMLILSLGLLRVRQKSGRLTTQRHARWSINRRKENSNGGPIFWLQVMNKMKGLLLLLDTLPVLRKKAWITMEDVCQKVSGNTFNGSTNKTNWRSPLKWRQDYQLWTGKQFKTLLIRKMDWLKMRSKHWYQ